MKRLFIILALVFFFSFFAYATRNCKWYGYDMAMIGNRGIYCLRQKNLMIKPFGTQTIKPLFFIGKEL